MSENHREAVRFLVKKISEHNQRMCDMGNVINPEAFYIECHDGVLDIYGFPKDNYGDVPQNDPKCFCRDHWANLFFAAGDDDDALDLFIKELDRGWVK